MMQRRSVLLVITALLTVAVTVGPALASGPPAPFFNGFEVDTAGWFGGGGFGTITREPSGYTNSGGYASGIASASGGFHARINPDPPTCTTDCAGPYTLWGTDGNSAVFPVGGFATQLDIYLDVAWAATHPDVRFDWDTAMQSTSLAFLSDFVFNAGTTPVAYPGGPGFVVGSSPNASRSGAFPENPCPSPSAPPNYCRTPVLITTSGWYTFRHTFRDDGSGQLAVDLTILNQGGGTVATWTIYQGFAISIVGGPAYGFLANEEIPDLPIDNSQLTLVPIPLTDFRDVRRVNDINIGPDLGGTGHTAINFTGSTGAGGDAWITVYDPAPNPPPVTFGSVSLSADVLIHTFNNTKGAGPLALYNEASGKKGLALVLYDAGNSDSVALVTVDQAGSVVVLKSVALAGAIAENVWYRVTMDVVVSGATVSVTGKVFKHVVPSDPNSLPDGQVGATLSFSGSRPAGVDATGEVGILASAKNAAVDTSVTNFLINP